MKALLVILIIAVVAILIVYKRFFGLGNPGNKHEFDHVNMPKVENSPLEGKNFIFLGSSVTRGMASFRDSFVDMIAFRNNCNCVKEAVSGTTLVKKNNLMGVNYITRMEQNLDVNAPCDVFICQLSTNDATKGFPYGEVSDSFDIDSFDQMTIAGAIEYIIAYVKKNWNCPIAFYTSPRYDDPHYPNMVALMEKIADKWDINIIDLWNNDEINEKYNGAGYKNDKIHPTKMGYQKWTPVFEAALAKILAGEKVR